MSGTDAPERTFAALAPAHGRAFAGTWWGLAWLKALEDTALDGQQLKKGRRYARAGAVGAVSVRPGRITAVVQDPDSTRYRSDVLLQQLSDQEWDRFLDMAVESAGHIAALLDREMPPHLVEDAAAAGLDLLPGVGDLEPGCSCDAWDHCPHTAALCYQVARLLDEDPFVLLLMRGRDERGLLDELQRRSAGRAAGPESAGACEEDREPGAYGPTRPSPLRTCCRRCPRHRRSRTRRAVRRPSTRRPARRRAWTRARWSSSRRTRPAGRRCCWPKRSLRTMNTSRQPWS